MESFTPFRPQQVQLSFYFKLSPRLLLLASTIKGQVYTPTFFYLCTFTNYYVLLPLSYLAFSFIYFYILSKLEFVQIIEITFLGSLGEKATFTSLPWTMISIYCFLRCLLLSSANHVSMCPGDVPQTCPSTLSLRCTAYTSIISIFLQAGIGK